MIVRPKQHWLRLIFVWHGSVLHQIPAPSPTDLALDALCITIERSLFELDDVAPLPQPHQPTADHVLT